MKHISGDVTVGCHRPTRGHSILVVAKLRTPKQGQRSHRDVAKSRGMPCLGVCAGRKAVKQKQRRHSGIGCRGSERRQADASWHSMFCQARHIFSSSTGVAWISQNCNSPFLARLHKFKWVRNCGLLFNLATTLHRRDVAAFHDDYSLPRVDICFQSYLGIH
jgi:hypothetical protein